MALHSALAQKGSSPEGLDPFHTSLRERVFPAVQEGNCPEGARDHHRVRRWEK